MRTFENQNISEPIFSEARSGLAISKAFSTSEIDNPDHHLKSCKVAGPRLEKYIKAASDFEEIRGQVEKLQNALREYQNIACYLTYRLSLMIREHLEMTCPDEQESLKIRLSGLSRSERNTFIKVKSNLKVV